ncbi:MAG: flagellar hook-associated protein FlgL [Pseudomonas sp.]
MRISSLQAFNNAVGGIQRNYSNVTRTQEQISTGKKILTPADDPVASARLLQLEQEQGQYDQYQSNLTAAQNSLTQEEAILTSVGNVLQRIREIAVQAGNAAQDRTDKASLAKELTEREEELLNLMNSRNARGEYLFAGNLGKTEPFVRNPNNTYSYVGDEGQREIQIASSTFIAINDNGKRVFEDVFNANRVTTNKAATGVDALGNPSDSRVSLGVVEDKLAYDSSFPSSVPAPLPTDGIGIRFISDTDYVVYNQASPPVFPVTLPDPLVLGTGSVDSDPGTTDVIRFRGVRVQMDGTPRSNDLFNINRNPAVEKKGVLNVVAELRQALESAQDSPAGSLTLRDRVAVGLTNLDAVYGQVLQSQGEIGGRLNVLESTENFTQDVTLINQSVQSDLRDLDYAEALSRLSFQSIILEAAQKSYVRISSLNLFSQL